MNRPKICLTLTGRTIKEDLALIAKYRNYIDLAELRVDFLDEDETFKIRSFPEQAQLPIILTIRRRVDGGRYESGESSRTMLFARALAFADQNPSKNFAYVDFEEDFRIPSLQDGAIAFGTRIIRSYHNMNGTISNLAEKIESMCSSTYEIPKIAVKVNSLSELTAFFREVKKLPEQDRIFCAMGSEGVPSRILSYKLKSFLTYTTAPENMNNTKQLNHLDPVTLCDVYHFRSLNENTKIFGITGYPLLKTLSPEIHNKGYELHKMNAVFVPVRSASIQEAVEFADTVDIQGMAVTVPHKEAVLDYVKEVSEVVGDIGACNTILKRDGYWYGYNTDAGGFREALQEFIEREKIPRYFKVAIIGAGGAAKAVAYTIKKLGGKACIFNRTLSKAKSLAQTYGFSYAGLSEESVGVLEKYSSLIIQTTSKGMGSEEPSNVQNDPIWFYKFMGTEKLFDIVYEPEITPVMKRASDAGCKVSNGYPMLKYQGYRQFKIFTGDDYEHVKSE